VPELLIEVGFEEMPAPWLPGLGEQLRARFVEAAGREHVEARDVATFWTPRRLVLGCSAPARQPDREERVFGPSLKVAKDAAGKWTKAAEGFARKSGVAVDELKAEAKEEGKPGGPEADLHLVFLKKTAGRPTDSVLPGILGGVLRALSFPKRMSWDAWLDDGRGAFPFGRPIRWMVFLFDGRTVPFDIHALGSGLAGEGGAKGQLTVVSGNQTRGHRFLPKGRGGEPVAVSGLADLRDRLRERFCMLDPGERLTRIEEGLRAASAGARFEDHGLREEWRDLVEYPTVVVGAVPGEFRRLPVEVLETVLVHHQKYVPLRDGQGSVSRFAAVVNGDGEAAPSIVRGMERVVVARLRDAAFFLAEDEKRPLADRVSDLAGVTFHRGLGTYRDKAERLVRIVEKMDEAGLFRKGQKATAVDAAWLAKADLTTLMVREFPELQGVMGAIHLAREGRPAETVSAVRWHYHPIAVEPEAEPAASFAGKDDAARVFAAVSLADKLDTLAGYFGLGESPTGSRDPYGLRRAGQGAIRAVLDFWRPEAGEKAPDLRALVRVATDGYPSLKEPPDITATNVAGFLLDRLDYVLQARGFSADEVSAVLAEEDPDAVSPAPKAGARPIRALADPIDALRRVEALQRIRREVPEDFAALAEAFKRAKNILAQAAPPASVEPKLFETDAERALFEAASRLQKAAGSYDDRLRGLAALRAPVGRFFDDVLVMAEEPRVRGNRLALLKLTLSLFYRIADISKLGGTS
jgi:glycyl-tRNA synthetase beta chain